MNERLRKAFESEPVPRDLAAKVRTRLGAPAPAGLGRLISSLALLVVLMGGAEYYAANRTHEVFRTGVADHIHCAIAGAYPRQTNRIEMNQALGPWAPVLQPVLDQAPGDEVISAHRCTIQGRDYVHIILRRNGTMISVITTRRGEREGFPRELLTQVITSSGIRIHLTNQEGYSIAGFNAGAWLGYVVSGLPLEENQHLAEHIAPILVHYTG